MNYQDKTKSELIKELQELQMEYDSLKKSYKKEIIESKQVAEALEFTRMILDNAADTMVCIDYDGRYIDFNEALCRTVGYSREELLSMTVHDIDPLYTAAVWPGFMEKLKKAGSLTFESLHRTKEGKIIPVEINVSYFEHNGKEYHCGLARDITERKQEEEELALLAHTIRSISESVSVTDQENKILFVNDAFLKTYGYTLDELIGKSISIVRSTTTEPSADDILRTTFQGGWQGELLNQKKDGTEFPIALSTSTVCNEKGQAIALVGIATDITERKQTEDALKNLLSLTEATLESIHNGILVISLQRTVIKTNVKFAEMWRIPGDILNSGDDKILLDYVHGQLADPDAFNAKVEELYEKPEAESFDLIYFKDGRVFERISRPMYLGGEPKGRVWSFLDITERKQAEEALRLEKENFRHSLDDSPLGVRIVTAEGDTIYANQTILNFYGYDSLGELQRTPLKDRYTPESYAQAQKRKHQRESGDLSAIDYEVSIVRKNGEIRHLQVFRKEVLWDGARQFQILYNDITERKKDEEEIRKSKKLLEDLHKHLDEIRENERALISREIHDQIGQSLTALKLDLSWMDKYINTNPEAAAKLQDMIELITNTIKDVQRISSDLRPGILDDLGLAAAIEWYSDEFEKRTAIKCSLNLDDSIFGDPQKNLVFFRVLQEALTNVIRHANASSVTIKLHQTQKGTTLTIQDNGIGITAEMIESTKALGLMGMRERVRQFDGKVGISSKKGEGTKLTVFIPEKKRTML